MNSTYIDYRILKMDILAFC